MQSSGASPTGRPTWDGSRSAREPFGLEGRQRDGPAISRQISYEGILSLRIGSRGADRLDGQPALVVERADGRYSSRAPGWARASSRRSPNASRTTAAPRGAVRPWSYPLKPGALAGVRELVAQGPPFDPARTALTQHELLLTEQEAIFVFETQSEDGLAALLGQLDILAAAVAWRDLVAGPPRLAAVAYAWERPEPRVVPAVGLGF